MSKISILCSGVCSGVSSADPEGCSSLCPALQASTRGQEAQGHTRPARGLQGEGAESTADLTSQIVCRGFLFKEAQGHL